MTKIIQISDCHLFADPEKTGYDQVNPFSSLKALLEQVKNQQADIILATGDISGDYSVQSYQHFYHLIRQSQLEKQLFVIPGNHDDTHKMSSNLPSSNLWLNHHILTLSNDWHIHLLNTKDQHSIGRISESDLCSLDQHLQQRPQQNHLLVAHHHPINCGGWMDKHQWQNRQDLTALVDKHKQVKGMVYGHIHMAVEHQVGHCWYMACPSTCWQYAADQATFATSQLTPGFRVINLKENGQIDTSIHRLQEQN